METASLESLGEDTPARAVEPQGLGEAATLVEEEVEVAVDRIQAQAADGAGERVEGAAHVERFHGDEDTNSGREAQHDRSR